ncbi:MAG: Mpv17/PMP22 family protein [Tenuifilaceae bacterium]|jgi:hypothetical protein|nr:Mpv17/PMP22 family protein [Bacteroidales bacterium]MDI9515557.1 Mpv17/PMP22 family protein [Bacteroidota bacterium]NLH57382.1 Mpv17/PMP22 family protein [Rikenellaceae bacterium]OQC64576.1 MAG: hypothetical protein BWX49_00547 [Bacteroidetes bacterium ADurb.Bin008]HNV81363.1 Mpv17/PMP22 family protein [Tenuifilaceae bacterium]
MKTKDIPFILLCLALIIPFLVIAPLQHWFLTWSREHAIIMSFIKFSVLATLGEAIGLRIRTGNYNEPNFGILPRAIVWGFLGITVKMAFDIFSTGTLVFIENLGVANKSGSELAGILNDGPLSLTKFLLAFAVSTAMNLIYAPMLMTFHKITDAHIMGNGGTLAGLFKPIRFGELLKGIDWGVMWNFVFKKTIPIFWIPAHTITFLLPPMWRVLFAALLSVALGIFLAIASAMSRKK